MSMKTNIRSVVALAFALATSMALAALPSGYRELAYVESHGTEWFDTGVVPDAGTACTVDVTPLNEVLQSRVISARNVSYEGMCGYLYFEVYVNGFGKWACGLQDDTGNWGMCTPDPPNVRFGERVRITLNADLATLTVNDGVGKITTSSRANKGQCAIQFMAQTKGATDAEASRPAFVGRFHGATIVQDGVVVREFVPCRRDSDGTVGLYDIASHEGNVERFYANQGTGTLTAGMALEVVGGKANLAFESADSVRTLYLAYGLTDGGDLTNGWEHVIEAGTVPAGVDHLDGIALPAGLGSAYSRIRAFIDFADASREMYLRTSRTYIQDGLYAQWDGIENGGVGVHNASSEAPVELMRAPLANLSRSGTLPPVDGKSFKFGSGSLAFKSSALTNAINAGNLTVELVLAENGAFVHNGGLITLGSGSRGLWIYQQHSDQYKGMISACCYHAVPSGQFDYLGLSPYGTPGIHTYSFSLGDNTTNSYCAVNGAYSKPVTRFSTALADDQCWLGQYQNGQRSVAKVYSIRLYTRKLSQEEIAANAAIDEIRFKSKPLDSSATWPRRLELLNADYQAGTMDVFLPPSEYRQTLLLACGTEDGGQSLSGWTNVVRICEIPAGIGLTNGVVIPQAARRCLRRQGGFRLFLHRGAESYVRRGLYAQWDGIENAGFLVHDPAATSPRELIGNITTLAAVDTLPVSGNKAFLFGSGHLSMHVPGMKDAINSGKATVEFVLEENGNFIHNSGIVSIGQGTRGLWIYQQINNGYNGMVSAYSYHAALSGEFTYLGLSPKGTKGIHTYSFALGDSTGNSFYATNGVYGAAVNRHSTTVGDDQCYIGTYPGTTQRPTAKVYSIRFYTEKLTQDEIAANAALDRARFRETLTESASSFYPTKPGGVLIVIR